MSDARQQTSSHVAAFDEWFVTADGRTFGPGASYEYTAYIHDIWTNGSGMFGPADGIERIIGREVKDEVHVINGMEVKGPVKLVRRVPEASS